MPNGVMRAPTPTASAGQGPTLGNLSWKHAAGVFSQSILGKKIAKCLVGIYINTLKAQERIWCSVLTCIKNLVYSAFFFRRIMYVSSTQRIFCIYWENL